MTTYCRINRLTCLEFSGKDAALFLQGQISINTKTLAAGQWQRFAYCSRQGKMIANGIIAKTESTADSDTFIVLLCSNISNTTTLALQKFILRAKVRITPLACSVYGIWHDNNIIASTILGTSGSISHDGLFTTLQADDRCLVLINDNDTDNAILRHDWLQTDKKNTDENQWWAQEIKQGITWIDENNQDTHIPQHINFELIGGINFTKGCFVGQEVIARLQHLGEIKKRAVIIYGNIKNNTLPMPGQKLLTNDNKAAGILINAVTVDNQSFIGLACTSTASHSDKKLLLDEQPVSIEMPPYDFPHKEKLKRTL